MERLPNYSTSTATLQTKALINAANVAAASIKETEPREKQKLRGEKKKTHKLTGYLLMVHAHFKKKNIFAKYFTRAANRPETDSLAVLLVSIPSSSAASDKTMDLIPSRCPKKRPHHPPNPQHTH